IISKLQRAESLDPKNVDHPLTGNWVGFRDCHIKPDLVLIYRIHDGQLQLARIGSHSDLF
ncbi:type II toxin-antitoxin system YafQ family toxin, partial [Vibrio parahaemolyticus]